MPYPFNFDPSEKRMSLLTDKPAADATVPLNLFKEDAEQQPTSTFIKGQNLPDGLMATSQSSRGITNENNVKLEEKIQQISDGDVLSKEAQAKKDAELAAKEEAEGAIPPTEGGEPSTEDTTGDIATEKMTADAFYEKQMLADNERVDAQIEETKAFLDDFATRQDALLKANINAITKRYDARRAKMEDINARYLESTRISGISSGRQRYAQSMHAGLLSTEEMDGQARLADIDAEELQLIAEAKQARSDSDIKAFNDRMSRMDELNKEKMDTLTKLHNASLAQDKLLEEKRKTLLTEANTALQNSFKTADSLASSVSEALAGFDTDEERQEYLNQITKKYDIEPEILMSSLTDYEAGVTKEELATREKESVITSREEATRIAQAREERLAKEKVEEEEEKDFKPTSSEKTAIGKYLSSIGEFDMMDDILADKEAFYQLLDEMEKSKTSEEKTEKTPRYLDSEYVETEFTKSTLVDLAKKYGFKTWGDFWATEKKNTIEYLTKTLIPKWREQGLSDKEIEKKLSGE